MHSVFMVNVVEMTTFVNLSCTECDHVTYGSTIPLPDCIIYNSDFFLFFFSNQKNRLLLGEHVKEMFRNILLIYFGHWLRLEKKKCTIGNGPVLSSSVKDFIKQIVKYTQPFTSNSETMQKNNIVQHSHAGLYCFKCSITWVYSQT